MQGCDYAQNGAYFVTICTHEREHIFGEVAGAIMQLNAYGEMVREEWTRNPRSNVELDAFVIMPNHVHGIVVASPNRMSAAKPRVVIEAFVTRFKNVVTKRINAERNTPSEPVWLPHYYEALIRSEITLQALRQYIEANPARWAFDKENI